MKTRQSPRRGNLGSALSSYSDEQKQVKAEDVSSVPTPPLAGGGDAGGTNHHPGEPAMLSDAEEKPSATVDHEHEVGNGAATVVSDTAAGGRSGSIDFRSRSDTFGSLGITLDDFRGRSETLGSAADVLADCLGPFPSVLDVNVHALPPDQRQVYSANQAQALRQQYQAAQQQQQQVPTSGALPVPKQIGGGGGSNPGSQPSSQGSASGFLSHNFGNSTRKVAAAAAAGSGGSSNQKIPAGGIAHTPPSALGPASYEAKHFGKRMRAGVSQQLILRLVLGYAILPCILDDTFYVVKTHIFFLFIFHFILAFYLSNVHRAYPAASGRPRTWKTAASSIVPRRASSRISSSPATTPSSPPSTGTSRATSQSSSP